MNRNKEPLSEEMAALLIAQWWKTILARKNTKKFGRNLYKSTLNVSRAAILTGYASGNEVILYNHLIES